MTQPFPPLRLLRLRLPEASLLWRRLEELPTDLGRAWRRGQLLTLIERLPLPALAVACPRCGGAGDRGRPDDDSACPGDCCRVCDYCMGRRWFARSEIRQVPSTGAPEEIAVISFRKTDRGRRATESQYATLRQLAASYGGVRCEERMPAHLRDPGGFAPPRPASRRVAGQVTAVLPLCGSDVALLTEALSRGDPTASIERLLRELQRP